MPLSLKTVEPARGLRWIADALRLFAKRPLALMGFLGLFRGGGLAPLQALCAVDQDRFHHGLRRGWSGSGWWRISPSWAVEATSTPSLRMPYSCGCGRLV